MSFLNRYNLKHKDVQSHFSLRSSNLLRRCRPRRPPRSRSSPLTRTSVSQPKTEDFARAWGRTLETLEESGIFQKKIDCHVGLQGFPRVTFSTAPKLVRRLPNPLEGRDVRSWLAVLPLGEVEFDDMHRYWERWNVVVSAEARVVIVAPELLAVSLRGVVEECFRHGARRGKLESRCFVQLESSLIWGGCRRKNQAHPCRHGLARGWRSAARRVQQSPSSSEK